MSFKLALSTAAAGTLIGAGLVISGMTQPSKVLNFLDVLAIPQGTWDATLMFVLGGALATTFIGYRVVLRQPKPHYAAKFNLPNTTRIDKPLVLGSALFGIGWGMAGYCPGPSLANLAASTVHGLGFIAAMVLGLFIGNIIKQKA
jgi:uncharacterized membrane protein YedE/YeeE